MKKETIITAVIFLAVGFLAGYITDAQMNWSARQKTAQTATAPSEMPPAGGAASAPAGGATPQQGLPEGHPPIDSAAIIKQLEEMAAQNPKDADIRLKLANFLYDQKQYSKAIEWYQRALELNPKDVNARTDLGTAYFYTGRPQDALHEYDKSLEIDPKHEQTLLNAIVVNLEGTHDLAAAQKGWDRLHKLNPNHPALAGLKEQINAARTSGSAAGPH
ncbi:MAG TPA: tetratricopeptide repeat protein [Terriglobia bacterium]|nr:tetratricopeptide repeat protein [Terriglobia bacterium]